MIVDFFLDQSRDVQTALVLGHGLVVLLLAWLFMRVLGAAERRSPGWIPVAPYFTAIATLYGLFFGFHAASIWANQHQAEHWFREGVAAYSRLHRLLDPSGVASPAGAAALARYAEATIGEEWAARNAKPSENALRALDDLQEELIRIAGTVPSAVGSDLMRTFDDLVKARAERLWIGTHSRNHNAWAVVLALGFLAHIAIAMVHAERPRAGALALALFALATTVAYWLLLDATNPFANVGHIDPVRLKAFLQGF